MSKKKQRDIELFVVDVFISIQKIKKYTKPFNNEEDFKYDELHWDATIRQLEIVGEALNNLLDNNNFNSLAPKYFRKIVNFRNTITHGYFGIDIYEVWDIITSKLDILEIDLKSIAKNNLDISNAINSEIEEYKKLKDSYIVDYLTSL